MGLDDGKVALISGIAGGQGRAHAVRLAEEGADIIGFDLCENDPAVEYPLATDADLERRLHSSRRLVAASTRRALLPRRSSTKRSAVTSSSTPRWPRTCRTRCRCNDHGMLLPEDVTATILHLVSDGGRFITGQTLIVDEGSTAR